MLATSGVCDVQCVDDVSSIKCSRGCGGIFHLKCVKSDGVKTRTGNKDCRCNICPGKKEATTSVCSKSGASDASALTKEFMINVLEAFI